ncbi:MAG: RNA methyltransferase [Gammaproteobacteria bacterium]|nr:RNA methyltransferase [Gammaproteobacteria bacterium]NND54627.1 RNA methyltransferase [Gammaproteobacteria bacterium]
MSVPVRFVLCETSHPGNIGAAARAIKTMGFSELVLVDPQDFPSSEADARASGAVDLLANARVVDTLAEAVADCRIVFGSSARRRKLRWPELNPRECAQQALDVAQTGPVSIVFGTERSGLSNEQMDLCNALVYIPANPDYSSLNLASAVQLIAYELHFALGDFQPPQEPEFPAASGEDMELFYAHLKDVMVGTGFMDPDNPRQLERKLRRLFNRAHVDVNELGILRGILAAMDKQLDAKSTGTGHG